MPTRDLPAAFNTAFGASVREAREALGLSQEDLAFKAELDRTYLSGIERGVRNPTLRSILRIARALETKPSALVERAEQIARIR